MKDGDEQAYVSYVSAKLPWLRKIAFLLCQDWTRADDITQTAITNLYLHWRRASAADNLDGYVRAIVVRAFLSDRRSGWSSRVTPAAEVADTAAVETDPTLTLAVRQALAEVAPRQRAALVLRFYLDLSVEETAEVLGCSPGTVKSQTARGLESLRRALNTHQLTVEG